MDLKSPVEEQRILALLEECSRLSLQMLPRMFVKTGPQAGLLCQKVTLDAKGELEAQGVSQRYSIIALLGMSAAFGSSVLLSPPWSGACDRLLELLGAHELSLGELGLLLWLDEYRDHRFTTQILEQLYQRWPKENKHVDTMERAWVLTGLCRNRQPASSQRSQLTAAAVASILRSFRPAAGLFALNGYSSALYGSADRVRHVLGSFASQVYSLLALSAAEQCQPDAAVREVIRRSAERVCELQGPRGEWWWIFDTRGKGSVALDYPVYSVHQDAMGPMGLLAASSALGTRDYLPAIAKGLECLFQYREPRTGDGFVDAQKGVIWRAAIKDIPGEDPANTPFGLGAADLQWMRSARLPGFLRGSPPPPQSHYRILKEARPYCPGWILTAYVQACELAGAPVNLQAGATA